MTSAALPCSGGLTGAGGLLAARAFFFSAAPVSLAWRAVRDAVADAPGGAASPQLKAPRTSLLDSRPGRLAGARLFGGGAR